MVRTLQSPEQFVGTVWERTEFDHGPVARRYLVSSSTAYADGQEEVLELVRLSDGAELKTLATALRVECWYVGAVSVVKRYVRHGDGRPVVAIPHYDLRAAVEAARAL